MLTCSAWAAPTYRVPKKTAREEAPTIQDVSVGVPTAPIQNESVAVATPTANQWIELRLGALKSETVSVKHDNNNNLEFANYYLPKLEAFLGQARRISLGRLPLEFSMGVGIDTRSRDDKTGSSSAGTSTRSQRLYFLSGIARADWIFQNHWRLGLQIEPGVGQTSAAYVAPGTNFFGLLSSLELGGNYSVMGLNLYTGLSAGYGRMGSSSSTPLQLKVGFAL